MNQESSRVSISLVKGQFDPVEAHFAFCFLPLIFLEEDDTKPIVLFHLLLVYSRDENTTSHCKGFVFQKTPCSHAQMKQVFIFFGKRAALFLEIQIKIFLFIFFLASRKVLQ